MTSVSPRSHTQPTNPPEGAGHPWGVRERAAGACAGGAAWRGALRTVTAPLRPSCSLGTNRGTVAVLLLLLLLLPFVRSSRSLEGAVAASAPSEVRGGPPQGPRGGGRLLRTPLAVRCRGGARPGRAVLMGGHRRAALCGSFCRILSDLAHFN